MGLSAEGNLRFKTDWARLIVGNKFCFTLYLRAVFRVQAPRGAYIWRGDLTEGFFCATGLGGLHLGVANGTTKNVALGKFWQDLEISEAFEVSFLHGLFLLFLSLETFYQRVSRSDF